MKPKSLIQTIWEKQNLVMEVCILLGTIWNKRRSRIELNKLEFQGKKNKIFTYGLYLNLAELDSNLGS